MVSKIPARTQTKAPAKKPSQAPARTPAKTPAAQKLAATTSPAIDQDALSLEALAKGVLANDFRARVATIRRLAEAVLAKPETAPKPKPNKKKKKKAAAQKSGKGSAKESAKKSGGKKRKLAKIPGQKGKKKS